LFFFSSRRRHTRSKRDWSSDVCSSDLSLVSRALSITVNHLDHPVASHSPISSRSAPLLLTHSHSTSGQLRQLDTTLSSFSPPKRSEERRVGTESGSSGSTDESRPSVCT